MFSITARSIRENGLARRQLAIEPLESRKLLTISASWNELFGSLEVYSDALADHLRITSSAGTPSYISIWDMAAIPPIEVWNGGVHPIWPTTAEPGELQHLQVFGGGANDTLDLSLVDASHGYAPEDVFADGGGGNDWIVGTPYSDMLVGDDGDGVDFGSDTILGNAGDDVIFGDERAFNRVDRSPGAADSLLGESGDDVIYDELGNDTIEGNAGVGRIYSTSPL